MSDDTLIGKTINGYYIEKMLGQGGMAAVYEAADLNLSRKVAIKVMHQHLAHQQSFQLLFAQEARNAARLDHPNIVKVFDFDVSGEQLYIVMELVAGGNLRKYVKYLAENGQVIGYAEAAEIVRQVAAAMHYAHEHNMTHRDLKPDNIILKPLPPQPNDMNYQPIVTDFGLARLTAAGDEMETATQPIGTYPYMSPEQVNAEPIDRRTDIYALGVILYELSVGRLPFNPKTIAEAARMHGREAVPPPSEAHKDFPEPLETIIRRALKKVPDDRYQTAGDMAENLKKFIGLGDKIGASTSTFPKVLITGELPVAGPSDEPVGELEDPEFQTAVQTEAQTEPLPVEIPASVALLERPPDQPQADFLAAYTEENAQRFELTRDNNEFVIGRDVDVDLQLDGEQVSRRHGVIERKPNGKYYYTDGGSTNGSFIGNRNLQAGKPIILNDGDVLRLGEWWVQFMAAVEAPTEDAPPDEPRRAPSPGEQPAIALTADGKPKMPTPPPSDGPDTQIMGIAPLSDMPQQEPPKLTPKQLQQDRIIIYHEGETPRLVSLDSDQLTLGRAPTNAIVLSGPYVSWSHASLERDVDGRVYVRPLNTTNGTWLDQQSLEAGVPHPLPTGRVLRIGAYWITFETGQAMGFDGPGGATLISRAAENFDDSIDTVAMVRPLSEEMPAFQIPPMSEKLRTSDRVVFFSEDQPIQIEPLDRETITIGRGSNQDIRLRGKRVSREHVILELRKDGNIFITDIDSRNGVWVGDTLLVPQTQVLWAKHEILRIGNYWGQFQRGSSGSGLDIGSQRDERGLIGKTIGSYRLDSFLGESALSATYKARDMQLSRDVALKIMNPSLAAQSAFKQRFLEEARIISRLDHPSVVKVLSYNELNKELFMVMELITGGNMRRMLVEISDRGKQLELTEATDMIIDIANGLHYAHQQGLIHRDINPDNIMMRSTDVLGPIKDYTPVLTDFAVSDNASADAIYEDDTESQAVYPYMSPEQCLGERNDVRSDIYELGTTFYELLIGRTPFKPRSLAEAVRMHTRENILPPSTHRADITPELDMIVMRALARNPNDRYQSAIDFARALERAMTTGRAPDATPGQPMQPGQAAAAPDDQTTQVLPQALPSSMPLLTKPPVPDGDINHDRLVFYSENYPTLVRDVDKPVITVGRGDDQDVRLAGQSVSRRHMRIEQSQDGSIRVKDEGSTNGTLLGAYALIEDVVEIWDPTQTIRLGDYWLRLETRQMLEDARQKITLVSTTPSPDDNDYETDAGWSPPPNAPKPEHDKIGVNVPERTVRVQPGSSVVMSLEITNQNDYVDHFNVEVFGLPRSWFSYTSGDLDLMPYNRETASVTFHPPLEAKSTAGAHAFELRVSSRAKSIQAVRTQCTLQIEPFYGFRVELYPERVRNKGNVELSIRNTGNTHTTFNIRAHDREEAVRFAIEGGVQYALAPGSVEDIGIYVEPRNRPLLGVPRYHQMEFEVIPLDDVAGGTQTVPGELAVTARFRLWMIFGPLLLLLLCGVLTAAGVFWNRRQATLTATEVAINNATQTAATATALLEADDDGDGLPNRLEQELGTFIELRDSDEDGLDDGTEYRVWSTEPLNRDTDGDGLSDGEEVLELGTNPLKADSDDDGFPDSQDPFPSIQATLTPTPFPIDEEGCAGSPPPRMIIDETAFVETGGVANRLRAEPSTEAEILDFMQPDESFVVLEGPTCDETLFLSWWKVSYGGTEGWTAEGEGEEYYLRPANVEPGEGGGGDAGPANDTGDESAIDPGAVTAELPASGEVTLDQAQLGIQLYTNITPDEWNTALTATDGLGVGWVKLQANWAYLQPDEAGQTTQQLTDFYAHIATAKAAGYNVLVSVAKAPDWARSTTSNDGPPDDPALLAAFVTEMLDTAGENIDAIEVWNEPNLSREWTGTLAFDGTGYMTLFLPTYEAVRAYSGDMRVVTAGLAPTSTTEATVGDREYLRQMYDQGLANLDNVAIGVHPYGWANPPDVVCCDDVSGFEGWDDDPSFFFLNTLVAYRNIQLRYTDEDAPLWPTEFGYSSWQDLGAEPPEPWMGFLSPEQKANYIYRAFEVGQSLDYVGPMFLWNLNFANTPTVSNRDGIAGFSLMVMNDGGGLDPRASYSNLAGRLP